MISLDAARIWNVNPLVATIDQVLTPEQCQSVIDLAKGKLKRAKVVTEEGTKEVSESRTNSKYSCPPDEPAIAKQVRFMIGMCLRMPITQAEPLTILHYGIGQEFKPHPDGFMLQDQQGRIDRFEAEGGQRLFSTMLYLNDVEGGGGTAFPKLGFSVAPHPGRLLIFANTLAGSRDMANLSLHAGEPVTAGEKWTAITWWREGPFSAR